MSESLTYVEVDLAPFDNGQIFLDFDGSDGSTDIVDSNAFGSDHVWTAVGNAQIDTSEAKFGSGSLLLDGSGDWVTGDGSAEAMGTSDGTVDMWIRHAASATEFLFDSGGATSLQIFITAADKLSAAVTNSVIITGSISITTLTWTHIAWVRLSGVTTLYVNGVANGTSVDASNYTVGTSRPIIGARDDFALPFNGRIDRLRLTVGRARWTSNFTVPEEFETFRFAIDALYLPKDISAIPSIKDVRITPSILSLGQDLGQRASIEVLFKDHEHVFIDEDFDSGTFWGKFRARYGLKLRGRDLRLYRGVVGDSLESMEIRYFVIESVDGPKTNGEYTIKAQDLLKLADGDRAQAPILSNGFLASDITASDTTIVMSPTGIGDSDPYATLFYYCIGGNEIVAAIRDNVTKLLLHFDGTNGATTSTDEAPVIHAMTMANGAALSTAQFIAGTASVLLDGTNDVVTTPDSADWFLSTNDFTAECWVYTTNIAGATRAIWSQQTDANNYMRMTIAITTGVVGFRIVSGGVDVVNLNGGAISINTWTHVAIVRDGSSFRIYVAGISVATTTTASAIPDFTGTFQIGGQAGGISTFIGHIDSFRFLNGYAAYDAVTGISFTPATTFTWIGSGDTLYVRGRGVFNTTAVAHTAGDRVQDVLVYSASSPATIINDLFVTYAGVDQSYINTTNWASEIATYLNTVYTAIITEPTSVNKLISELIEQAGLVIWWDDVGQQIRLQVLRAIATTADTFDADNMIAGSLDVKEQPEKRLSQVYTYFAKINPTVKEDQINNYRSTAATIDEQAEIDYGSPAIKKIFSRWITDGGRSVADTLNDILLARFTTPPRRISFDVMRLAGTAPALGNGYQLGGWPFQDVDGTDVMVPAQLVRLNPRADIYEVETEEVNFELSGGTTSPDRHTITFDSSVNNVNLKTTHDSLYTAAVSGVTVEVTIQEGVIIGSTSTSTPAFDVGTGWAAGVTITITCPGRIQGKGGAGGNGGAASFVGYSSGSAGGAGGTALKTTRAINLDPTNGEIWAGGGGGGGGGGRTDFSSEADGGCGGGGAAGTNAGAGGTGGGGTTRNGGDGFTGTASTGGFGNSGAGTLSGGSGGGPGLAGSAGTSESGAGGFSGGVGGAGGARGAAFDGVSFITFTGGASPHGDIRGTEIN